MKSIHVSVDYYIYMYMYVYTVTKLIYEKIRVHLALKCHLRSWLVCIYHSDTLGLFYRWSINTCNYLSFGNIAHDCPTPIAILNVKLSHIS